MLRKTVLRHSTAASPGPSPPRNPALSRALYRQLMKHEPFFNNEFRPMANSLSKPAFEACHVVSSAPLRKALQPYQTIPPLAELLRNTKETSESTAVEALRAIQHVRDRVDMTEHGSLVNVPYRLNVGDVVRHTQFGHVGVVAARLPACFESDQWILENLGSLTDRRLYHPWYLVLVSRHMGLPANFVRFGSQLTHVKVRDGAPSRIGYHSMLPTFFKGFDETVEGGRYTPRFDTDVMQADLSSTEVNGCRVPPPPPSVVDGPACKLPAGKVRTAFSTKP